MANNLKQLRIDCINAHLAGDTVKAEKLQNEIDKNTMVYFKNIGGTWTANRTDGNIGVPLSYLKQRANG